MVFLILKQLVPRAKNRNIFQDINKHLVASADASATGDSTFSNIEGSVFKKKYNQAFRYTPLSNVSLRYTSCNNFLL